MAGRREEKRTAELSERIRRFYGGDDGDGLASRSGARSRPDADERSCGPGGSHKRGRKCHLQRMRRATPARQDERVRRRPFEPSPPKRPRDLLGGARELGARLAPVEMRLEERRLELRKLPVDTQRCPSPRALTPL